MSYEENGNRQPDFLSSSEEKEELTKVQRHLNFQIENFLFTASDLFLRSSRKIIAGIISEL
jgi:hypothetical protein